MGVKWILRTLACIPLLTASKAWSAEVHGRSSTQFLWFTNILNDKETAELAQYLNLSISEVDQAGKLTFHGYGRISQNLGNGAGLNGRLYYLYADYRGLADKVDLKLGRQFVNYAAGTALIDGAQIDLRKVGPVAFSVMGGRNVVFSLDGESTHTGDYAYGAAAYLDGFKDTDLELSWFRKTDEGDLARDILGASFKQYLLSNIKLYGNTRYDISSEVFNELLAGVKYFPMASLVLTGEWYQSYPTFDTTSIYSVFAVDRYQEAVFKADYNINKIISVNGGVSLQEYGEGADAEVYEVGTRITPLPQFSLALNYDRRRGYGGKLDGGIAELSYDPTPKLGLAAGVHYDVIKRDAMTGRDYARRYWLGGRYRINDRTSAAVRVEDNVNIHYEEDWQGRVVFNYDF